MRAWTPDGALAGFERTTIDLLPEDDGSLVATVVRKRGEGTSDKAVLYVHGFVDYFFQEHVANALIAAGWDFYALELRRYGRSLGAGNRPNYCTSLSQYDAEITAAISILRDEDKHATFVLCGHSTGGLIASLYADSGARRGELNGVILNSPFFGFKVGKWDRAKLQLAIALGRFLPWLSDPKAISPLYGQSIHSSARGEWHYDLRWKPIAGFPAYFGWLRAISKGHKRVEGGLAIQCPVLVLHSDKSGGGREWNGSFHSSDIVLNVDDMRRLSATLGAQVQREEIPGAIHDVMLSREPVRARALGSMLNWLRLLSAGTAAVSAASGPSDSTVPPSVLPAPVSPSAT